MQYPHTSIKHLAVILDGNRRFAKKLMLEPWRGHEFGYKKVEEVLQWCIDAGIKELTLYTFSLQNFNRPKEEFDYLMNVFRDSFDKFSNDPRLQEHGIRVKVIGRYKLFPQNVVERIENIMEQTKEYKGFKLNIAMAYGGREELVDAFKKMLMQKANSSEITEEYIAKNLYIDSEPDLIIRTGGEKRTSNFLAWQSIYSEWFFLEKTWPEFAQTDFVQVLNEYNSRERRFGK